MKDWQGEFRPRLEDKKWYTGTIEAEGMGKR